MNYGHATETEQHEINQLIILAHDNPHDSKLYTRLGALLFVVCFFPPEEIKDYLQHAIKLTPIVLMPGSG